MISLGNIYKVFVSIGYARIIKRIDIARKAEDNKIMDCSNCVHYNRGRGQKNCLKCKKYKELQLKSVKRESIKTEHIPQAVLDNIADPRTRTLMDIIAQLPTNNSGWNQKLFQTVCTQLKGVDINVSTAPIAPVCCGTSACITDTSLVVV